MKTAAAVAVALSIVVLAALAVAVYWPESGTAEPTPAAAPPVASAPPEEPRDLGEPPWRVIEHDEPITFDSLPGTTWRAGPYTLAFESPTAVIVNRRVPGQWAFLGDAVTVNAGGQTLRGTIDGASMVFEGRQAERIEFTEPDGPQASRPAR